MHFDLSPPAIALHNGEPTPAQGGRKEKSGTQGTRPTEEIAMSGAKTCRQCGNEVALMRLERIEGENTGIRVEMEGLPAYSCARGHRRFLTPDFPMRLIEQLVKTDGVFTGAHAVKKGLLRKHYHCPGCGGELTSASETPATAKRKIEIQDGAAFEVGLTVPQFRCASCARDVLHPEEEMRGALMEAAATAFRAASIPPG